MKRWLPVGLWLIVIFVGSSIPNVPSIGTHTVDSWVHRVAHVAEYTVLGWLLMRALANGRPLSRRTAAITLVIVIAYGFSDEFHQRFTPGRNSDAVAVLWDGLGAAIGIALWAGWARVTARRRAARLSE